MLPSSGLRHSSRTGRQNKHFPNEKADLAPAVVGHLAAQVGIGADVLDHLALAGFDDAAEARFRTWLCERPRWRVEMLPREPASLAPEAEVSGWFARERVRQSDGYRLDCILRSTRAAYDDARSSV